MLSLVFIFMKMKYKSKSDAVLLLEDGTVFFGKSAGMTGTATGEICFNTGMTGYQEIFTDPSYFGQIMLTRPRKTILPNLLASYGKIASKQFCKRNHTLRDLEKSWSTTETCLP